LKVERGEFVALRKEMLKLKMGKKANELGLQLSRAAKTKADMWHSLQTRL